MKHPLNPEPMPLLALMQPVFGDTVGSDLLPHAPGKGELARPRRA